MTINYLQIITTPDTNLIVTEPPLNFSAIQEAWDEMIFEEYGFKSLFRYRHFFYFISFYNFDLNWKLIFLDRVHFMEHWTPCF